MSSARKFLITGAVLAGLFILLVAGGVGYLLLRHNPDAVAQARLDQLLGKPGQSVPMAPDQDAQGADQPDQTDQMMRHMLAQQQAQMDLDMQRAQRQNIFGPFGMPDMAQQPGMPQSGGVSVDETGAAYELRVPVQKPEDAQNVDVHVDPHRVQISGKITYRSADGHQTGSSSFMQVFPTSSEVLPDKVTRTIEGKAGEQTLVVTIPKKYPGKAPEQVITPQPPDASPKQPAPQQVSPDVIRQLRQSKPRYI